MLWNKSTDIQKVDKGSVPAVPEQTHPGPVYTPAVDIFESDDRISLLADMPGVKAKDLKIDLRENVLTLSAPVTSPESPSETAVLKSPSAIRGPVSATAKPSSRRFSPPRNTARAWG